jgi:arylformamidase
MVLADQVRRSPGFTATQVVFGGDPSRLYLGGQSSGGHLAAVAMTTDWPGQFELPADTVKGGLLVSGMYELAAVRLSKRSAYVSFDDRTVEELSPIRHLGRSDSLA